MTKIIENYQLEEVIGEGQYGKVYKSKNLKTGSYVAVKVVKI
jgi:serine/threonine protein kinase